MSNSNNENWGNNEAQAVHRHSQPQQAQLLSHYQNFVQNAPDEEVNQAHQDYFQQMPKAQQMGLFDGLTGALRNHGIDPRQAGVNTTDPQQASAGDLGNLFNLARNSGLLGGLFGGNQAQQSNQGGLGNLVGGLFGGNQSQPSNSSNRQPNYNQNTGQSQGGLQGLLSNPLAQAAISGLVGYVANRAINGYVNRNQNPAQSSAQVQPNFNQPAQNPQATDFTSGGGSALPGFEDQSQSSGRF